MTARQKPFARIASLNFGSRRNNILVACGGALVVAAVGFGILQLHASGFFASSEPELGTVATNASVINDTGASGGKAVQFNAPVTPPPAPPPPPSGGGSCPLPAYPDASCTGVPAGTVLTAMSPDDPLFSTPGAVISGRNINGCVTIKANNITIKNSKITCTPGYGVKTNNGGTEYTGTVLQDDELDGMGTADIGIGLNNVTATRLNIHDFGNGLYMDTNITLTDSYIHDLACPNFNPTTTGCSNGQHPDGIQFNEGGINDVIQHNTISAPPTNSAIIMWDDPGVQDGNVLIDNNHLIGGGFTLYCPTQNTSNIRVTNNHFGTANFGHISSGCVAGHVAVWSGNIEDGTNAVVPLNP